MPFKTFDRSRLKLKPLSERKHLLGLDHFLQLNDPSAPFEHPHLRVLADRIVVAARCGAPVIMMMGAHLVRAGVSRLIIDLMERHILSHIAMNGAGPIHDYEMARIGATTESVAEYIAGGQFGLWRETGEINNWICRGAEEDLGFGEIVGRAIEENRFPHRELSILAAGYRLQVPVTVHVGIGYDIIHEHPSCDGASLGKTSYHDFLIFVEAVTGLEGGVLLNFGSAVMAPEVFLKALSMARNVAHQHGKSIAHFTTGVFDLVHLEGDTRREAPRSDPTYYFRPYKTLLVRTVSEGESFYVQGDHRETFSNLYRLILEKL
ncbi:MAG TPA: hypothetical protein VGQ81_06720 [Acidobacteriota bacterium]|jgi:hypothetical protein|nr:hypothetical protein [Acidobacteriota bacterium]